MRQVYKKMLDRRFRAIPPRIIASRYIKRSVRELIDSDICPPNIGEAQAIQRADNRL